MGLCQALADAASGRRDRINWPGAASRQRWQALREDARQTVRDLPGIGRALVAAAGLARRSRGDAASATRPFTTPHGLSAGRDEPIALPTETIFVDADEWDARAESLGGTSNALLAGLAARLALRAGRVVTDGSVTVAMPVNDRTAGDTRANAVTEVEITVDPAAAKTDLRDIRTAIRQALIDRQDMPDKRWELLPLVLLLPQRLVRRMVGVAAGSASVVSSNLGVVNPAAYRPDGTAAEHFAIKAPHPDMTEAAMRRVGGMLSLVSGRANGQVFVSVLAYQPSRPNSNDDLRRDLSSTMDDFSLTATMSWGCPEPLSGGAVGDQANSCELYALAAQPTNGKAP
jgi:hypothetical protein